jgi:hypothetical protein
MFLFIYIYTIHKEFLNVNAFYMAKFILKNPRCGNTNASLQIAHNVPITTVVNRLGHANTATTTKVYAHAIREADAAAAEVIEVILTPATNKSKHVTNK